MQGDAVSTHAIAASVRTRGNTRADDDASMRAVRRRGSWESGESRWSWKPGAGVDNFSLLRRGNEDLDDMMSTNRSSVHTRDSYRTAITTWDDIEDEPSNPLTPDSATGPTAQAEPSFAEPAFAPPKAPMSVLV